MKSICNFFLGFAITFLLLGCWGANAAEVRAVLEPTMVAEGEYFTITLSSSGSGMPQLQSLPENFVYVGSSQQMHIVNGRRSNSVSYQFIAPAPGKYTIEPLKVQVGKQIVMTESLTLEVAEDDNAGFDDRDVFMQVLLHHAGKNYYVNEEIAVDIKVLYPAKYNVALNYPVLNIANALFRDFRAVNSENPNFDRPRRSREMIDGKIFDCIIFTTAFRALRSGELTLNSSVECQIEVPSLRSNAKGRSSRRFFRRINRELTYEEIKLNIQPLPEVPENGLFLGVVGECRGTAELSGVRVRAMEAVSLNIKLDSAGTLETLRAPELVLPGCRVYPGEIRRENNQSIISYVIIPLRAEPLRLDLSFLYFDPAAERYQAISVKEILQVQPNELNHASDGESMLPEAIDDDTSPAASGAQTALLYCKKSPESRFSAFYRRNRVVGSVMLLAAGLVILIAGGVVKVVRKHLRKDPSELRRQAAGERRRELWIRLQKASSSELVNIASGDLTDFLSDRWKLAPGSTIKDVADKAYDVELAEALRECANVSYLPEQFADSALKDAEKIRRILIKSIKTLLLASSCILYLAGAELSAVETSAETLPATWEEALHSYDRGEYDQAKAYFEKYDREHSFDPNVYYNLGCIAAAHNEYEMALYYFECAGLALPGDENIQENRNVLRRKMFLPEAGRTDSPDALIAALRDNLHPEDYLLLASLAWCILCIYISCSRKWRNSWRWSTGLVIGAFILLCLTAMYSLYASNYRSGQALTVAKNVPVYTFPGQHNGTQCGTLHGGTPVQIIEKQSNYYLVRNRDLEGWVPQDSVKILTD